MIVCVCPHAIPYVQFVSKASPPLLLTCGQGLWTNTPSCGIGFKRILSERRLGFFGLIETIRKASQNLVVQPTFINWDADLPSTRDIHSKGL